MEWAGGVECFIFNRNDFIISFWDKWMPPAGGVECFIFNTNDFIISFWDKWMPPAGGVECFIFNTNDFIISFWDKWMPPLMDCHLAVVEGLECLRDPANSAGRGLASGRCNQAGKINGERPDKRAVKKKLFKVLKSYAIIIINSHLKKVSIT